MDFGKKKPVSDMTYSVFGGTLNLAQLNCRPIGIQVR